MNFDIIFEIILAYILNSIISGTHVVDGNIDFKINDNNVENMDAAEDYSNHLPPTTVDNIELNSSDDVYCNCEFQSPLLLLGKPFDEYYIQKMCEVKIISYADISKHVRFTVTGLRVCSKICKRCSFNIQLIHKERHLKIILMEHYCEMIDKNSEFITNLANQCICIYHIQSKNWKTVIVYKIHANPRGLVKIESN